MRLALVISSLFPSGGLQRECVAIAGALRAAGHDVVIITADYRAPVDTGGVPVEHWKVGGLTNPGRDLRLGRRLERVRDRFDRLIGFNKMPNLDIYFCGDPAYQDLSRPWWRWLSPKFHLQLGLERQVFGAAGPGSILVLSDRQIDSYRRRWGTSEHRLQLIAPTLDPERRHPEFRTSRRAAMRRRLGIADDALLWLAIASAPRTKGLDRTLHALARFAGATLAIVGPDPVSRDGAALKRQLDHLGVHRRALLLGYRNDIPELMAAADLLVHPARLDTTGMVILEAIVNGLPAVVTSICGFAPHVSMAEAGIVIEEPFTHERLERALTVAPDPLVRKKWSENGAAYGRNQWLTSGHAEAVEVIVAAVPTGVRDAGPERSSAVDRRRPPRRSGRAG